MASSITQNVSPVGGHGVPADILRLVEQFKASAASYRSQAYNETQVRREFIDPFLQALGWDVSNLSGRHNLLKEVVHEDALRIGGNVKAPDYAIRTGGKRAFFIEAKKPSVNIRDGISSAYQLRRYAWSAKLPVSVLTDFEEFAVYDCRIKPNVGDAAKVARLMYFTFDEYEKRWPEISALFSRDAVFAGSLKAFAAKHRSPRGTVEVDSAFLSEIEGWRESLARDISVNNPGIGIRGLNIAVQLTIDRIIFLRMAEDRGIEPYSRLRTTANGAGIYKRLMSLFKAADSRYNSGLFHFDKEDGSSESADTITPGLRLSDTTLGSIIRGLYYPESPYEFSVLAPDTLGQVYEQFLGKTIRLVRNRAVVEDKPAVRKAGGVYYTPSYIVRHIVATTLDPLLAGKSPSQVSGQDGRVRNPAPIRIIDPACGSGSFLIEAYQYLLDWYRSAYMAEGPERHSKGDGAKLYSDLAGNWRLTIAERRRVLLTHIYGVDVDPQAVEVSKLSLLLKVLEGESGDAVASQMDMFSTRVLPDLSSNIKCGNSLIALDFYNASKGTLFDDDELIRINAFDWESEFYFFRKEKGFSAVIGNPPWVSLSGKFGNDILSQAEADYLTQNYSGNTYMPNLYEYFIERGLDLTKSEGRFSFIVPDRFGKNDQFIPLRKKVLSSYRLEEVIYRAPFPGVVADTLIFLIANEQPAAGSVTVIGDFQGEPTKLPQVELNSDGNRYRFENLGASPLAAALKRLHGSGRSVPLGKLTQTTSGFGGKSTLITRERASPAQRPVLKGESITKYRTGKPMFFEFLKANITGRTTDIAKLGWRPKVLIRKTGSRLIASYDNSAAFPEQSLYFTFGTSELNPFYLLGLLNSRLIGFLYNRTMLTNEASIAQIKKVDLDAIPIIITDLTDTAERISEVSVLAEQITTDLNEYASTHLEQKKTALRRRINSAVTKIDELIYALYGLMQEEIEQVEGWEEHLTLTF